MHILAYIDPGLGALIWQSILGIFVGLLFYMRRTRKWIGRQMRRIFHAGQNNGNCAGAVSPDKIKVEEADHL
jgi:hypothetical protein